MSMGKEGYPNMDLVVKGDKGENINMKFSIKSFSIISTYLLVSFAPLYHLVKSLLPEKLFSLATIRTGQK